LSKKRSKLGAVVTKAAKDLSRTGTVQWSEVTSEEGQHPFEDSMDEKRRNVVVPDPQQRKKSQALERGGGGDSPHLKKNPLTRQP